MECRWPRGNKQASVLVLGLLFWSVASPAMPPDWREIAPGFSYLRSDPVHAFRIDPKKFRLEVLLAKNNRHEFETAQSFAQNSGAKLVINGGYFSPEYQSLGLIVRNGVPINPKHPTSWWGIFHITDGKPMIDTPNNFKIKPTTTMALQAGPRLLVHGEIPHFKPGIAERSCVGLDAQGRVYIVALTEELWSLERLAQFLALSPEAGGLGLTYALNLDGGSSTQLYANFKGFRLHLPGTKPVANALALFPR